MAGHARIVVPARSPSSATAIYLWRYPERLATRSKKLNDYNFYWVYPRSFNPGELRTGPVTVGGQAANVEVLDHPRAGPRTLLRVTPVRPIAAGQRAVLDLDMQVKVPTRYGTFGCVHSLCTLAGGFYPMLPPDDESGQALLSAPPARADYRVTVGVSRVSDVVVDGALHAVERGGRVTVALADARAAVVMVGKPRFRQIEAEHRGQKIIYLTSDVKGIPPKEDQLLPYQPTDRSWRVIEAAKGALDLLAEIGLPMEPGRTLRFVEGEERMELALPLGGFTLLSNQIFDIFPLVRFLKFHEFQLVRAIYDNWADERIAARERPEDVGWAPDVAASYLVDLYTLRSYRKEEFARQILSWAGFIPAIDRILYAPQIQFASAYFYTLEDPDPLRDGLREFAHDRPRGKTVYSKLRDLVGEKGVDAVARRQILDGEPLRQAAEAVRGETLDWFFKQWLGPYPPVDYRFVEVASRAHAGGVTVTAVVEKRGEHPPVEPVEVAAVDKKGNRRVEVPWTGRGAVTRTCSSCLLAPLDSDRDQSARPVGRKSSCPNQTTICASTIGGRGRWKFIYNNFGGLVRVFPTLGIDLSLDFSLAPILDLKNAMRFIIYHSDATQIGVTGEYTRSFGRKITEGRLSSAFSTALTAARIDPSFGQAVGTSGPHPGTQIALGVRRGFR